MGVCIIFVSYLCIFCVLQISPNEQLLVNSINCITIKTNINVSCKSWRKRVYLIIGIAKANPSSHKFFVPNSRHLAQTLCIDLHFPVQIVSVKTKIKSRKPFQSSSFIPAVSYRWCWEQFSSPCPQSACSSACVHPYP